MRRAKVSLWFSLLSLFVLAAAGAALLRNRGDAQPLPSPGNAEGLVSIADYDDFATAVDAAIAQRQSLFIPEGTWRITRPVVIDVSRRRTEGFTIRGISQQSKLDTSAITEGDAITFLAPGAAASFNFKLEKLNVIGNTSGALVRFGERDCTHAFNRLVLNDVRIGNNGRGPACELCGVYVGKVYGEFVTSGWGGLILRQCFAVTFDSCNIGAMNGLALWITQGSDAAGGKAGGFVYNNVFNAMDIEAPPSNRSTTGVQIDSPNAHHNLWNAANIVGVRQGVIAQQGRDNLFVAPNLETLQPPDRFPQRAGISVLSAAAIR